MRQEGMSIEGRGRGRRRQSELEVPPDRRPNEAALDLEQAVAAAVDEATQQQFGQVGLRADVYDKHLFRRMRVGVGSRGLEAQARLPCAALVIPEPVR